MGILKQPGSNAVGVAKAVTAALADVQKSAPGRDEARGHLRHDRLHQRSR